MRSRYELPVWIAGLFLAIGLLGRVAAGAEADAGANAGAGAGAAESISHPAFRLVDADGENVLKSGGPVSPMQTCGGCHDTQYIAQHTYHAPNAGAGGAGAGAKAEMNCFLCHLPNPDNAARLEEQKSGRPEWVPTATLASTGIVKKTPEGWKWNESAFSDEMPDDLPRPTPPASANCGLCHGQVHTGDAPLTLQRGHGNSMTDSTGQIFSAQLLKDSALNLAGKANLSRPWDIHAQRGLECRNCHYSLNNPAYAQQSRPGQRFEPRKLTPGQFLYQPDHNFAKGHAPQSHRARDLDGTMRRCEGCHDAAASHRWLPYAARHFAAMNCEACHIPQIHAPARQQVDATLIDLQGNSITHWRGVDGSADDPASLIRGYRPVLLPRREMDGFLKLTPHNLITTWYWIAGDDDQRVDAANLKKALLDGSGAYYPDVMAALDDNRDGRLDPAELRLDAPAKVAAIRGRLESLGLKNPRIAATIQPYSLHHDVAAGPWATRDCTACHASQSRTSDPMALADYVPGGVMPTLAAGVNVELSGRLSQDAAGQLIYTPVPANSGRYIIGHDRWRLGNRIGFAAITLAVCGVILHGGLRVLASRRRKQP